MSVVYFCLAHAGGGEGAQDKMIAQCRLFKIQDWITAAFPPQYIKRSHEVLESIVLLLFLSNSYATEGAE